MAAPCSPSVYAQLAPGAARAVLAGLLLAGAIGVAVSLSPWSSRKFTDNKPPAEGGDVELFVAVVERVRTGEFYYQAMGTELLQRGYPTQSVFNWRTPLPIGAAGLLPHPALATALMWGLGITLALLSMAALAREGCDRRLRLATVVLLGGPLILCFDPNAYVLAECSTGMLIALSVCAYGLARPRLAVAIGLIALFFRELALPYCVAAAALAWRRGQKGEVAMWVCGFLAWIAWMGVHGWQVLQWMPEGGRAHRESWIQFGGLPFLIALTQMNAYLLYLPQWVAALYLVAALFGLAGWRTDMGLRATITTGLFLAAFCIVGQEFNQYWGFLFAPLLCYGVARFPTSLRDLWKAAHLNFVNQ